MRLFLIIVYLAFLPGCLAGQYYAAAYTIEPAAADPGGYTAQLQAALTKADNESITRPDTAQLNLMDSVINYLVSNSYWDSIGYFAIYESSSQEWGRINIRDTSALGSEVGAPGWAAAAGYVATTTANYLDTNWSPNDGVSTSSAAFWGLYVSGFPASGNHSVAGVSNSSFQGFIMQRLSSGSNFRPAANCQAAFTFSGVADQNEGFYSTTNDGTNHAFQFDGTELKTQSVTGAISPLSIDLFIGCVNVNGTPTGGNSGLCDIKGAIVGSISPAGMSDLSTILGYYFDNN